MGSSIYATTLNAVEFYGDYNNQRAQLATQQANIMANTNPNSPGAYQLGITKIDEYNNDLQFANDLMNVMVKNVTQIQL